MNKAEKSKAIPNPSKRQTTLTTADGASTTLDDEKISEFRSALRGDIIMSDHAAYESARRVWNGNIDRRPALIARCAGVADVQRAVTLARTHSLRLSIRGGGHSAPGYGTNDGGVVIDMSTMKGIRVDPAARTVRAQGGVIWRELDHETQAFGLATTGGTVSNTGIAGLTLGGGLGWLMGKHGLAIDNLISADVVTADGEFRKASAADHPDLFWALRGGGGNFGVVTSVEYRLHEVQQVLGGLVLYPMDQARDMLRFYCDFCATLPDEAEAYAALLTAPQGMPVGAMMLGYNGPISDGEKIFAPARQFGKPIADLVGPMPYTARQRMLDDPNATDGLQRYWRSAFTERVSDELIDLLVEGALKFSSPLTAIIFFYVHGAAVRVGPGDTAFAARRTQWDFDLLGQWANAAESASHTAWVKSLWGRVEPHLLGTAYVNHLASDDRPEKVRASFGQNYDRLRQVKRVYDPTNLFRLNANIAP
ncbi:MAG TPA: FAD-binding oxidoreductase [Terriglobia bacterium]|nr:FAD-binding oxidoreductase [Terriglobia bacterium]